MKHDNRTKSCRGFEAPAHKHQAISRAADAPHERRVGEVSERLVIELFNRQQAWASITSHLYPFLKDALQGSATWVLTVARKKRTPAQNRRYWGGGVLKQIAEQAAPGGKLYPAEVWHEQFKRQFIGVVELPNGQVIGKSSTELSTKEFCDFSDEVEAYAATELGVRFVDLEPHRA